MQSYDESLKVSRETYSRLGVYESLVRKWQKSINLISPNTVDQIWERHIIDSLAIFQIAHENNSAHKTWVDIGSGGGFPGIVTAICLTELDQGWVHLVESNQKKCAFLRSVIVETGARASVHPKRVEDIRNELTEIDNISARALASLDNLMAMTYPWFQNNKNVSAWFHKGQDYVVEIEKSRSRWDFDLIKYNSCLQDGSVILKICNLKPQIF